MSQTERKERSFSATPFNWLCFVVGMIGLWSVTHSGWALFWGWVAAIHLTVKIREPRSGDE